MTSPMDIRTFSWREVDRRKKSSSLWFKPRMWSYKEVEDPVAALLEEPTLVGEGHDMVRECLHHLHN